MLACIWWLVRDRSAIAPLGVSISALLSAPITMPFVEEALRSATLSAHGGNTLAPAQLLDLVWPSWHGHPATETWTRRDWSWANGRIHPGLAAMVLALMAVRLRNRAAWLLMALFGISILISLIGLPGPLNHARLASISALLVGVAAGLAIRAPWGPGAFLLVLGTGAWAGWHDQGSVPAEVHSPDPAPWTARLKEHIGDGRVIGLSWALQPNTGALIGVQDLRGYDLPVSTDTERLQMALNPRPIRPWFQLNVTPPINLLRWAGVRAILSTDPMPDPLDIGPAPLHASSLSETLPAAWKATAPQPATDATAAVRALLSAKPEAPPVEGLDGSWPSRGHTQDVHNFQRTSRSVRFTTDGPGAGIAVLSDAWHPGWTVTVNGTRATPLRVGGVFRGVRVGEGEQTVAWHFDPWGWTLGCWLFVLGLALSALTIRQRNKTASPKTL